MPDVKNFPKPTPPKRQAVRDLVYSAISSSLEKITVGEIEAIINSIIDIAVEESRLKDDNEPLRDEFLLPDDEPVSSLLKKLQRKNP